MKRSKVKVIERQKPPNQYGGQVYSRPADRAPAAPALTACGRGLEFPSVTQPEASGRTAAYHVGADIFVCSGSLLAIHILAPDQYPPGSRPNPWDLYYQLYYNRPTTTTTTGSAASRAGTSQ